MEYIKTTNQYSEHVEKTEISQLVSECRYEVIRIINSGSYGTVYQALDIKTGEIVAVKKEVHGLSKSTLREINILKSLPRHPSVVQLKDVIVEGRDHVYVVMEYLQTDLKRYIDTKGKSLGISEVKRLMKQLLEGINFLHKNGVMHRDLKPSNILININGDQLKICDFGLSREIESESGPYSPRVGTRWYKAPEIILGLNKYSYAVDIWSVGCIMAELILKQVLFKGRSEINQLREINKILFASNDVAPSQNLLQWMFLDEGLLTELGFDLLSKLLAFDSKKRITAEDALGHGWFEEFDSYFYYPFDCYFA